MSCLRTDGIVGDCLLRVLGCEAGHPTSVKFKRVRSAHHCLKGMLQLNFACFESMSVNKPMASISCSSPPWSLRLEVWLPQWWLCDDFPAFFNRSLEMSAGSGGQGKNAGATIHPHARSGNFEHQGRGWLHVRLLPHHATTLLYAHTSLEYVVVWNPASSVLVFGVISLVGSIHIQTHKVVVCWLYQGLLS